MALSPEGNKIADKTMSDVSDPESPSLSPPPSDSKKGPFTGNMLGANLPPNWSAAVSKEDGRAYYWNTVTGDTSWTHPNYLSGPLPPPSDRELTSSSSISETQSPPSSTPQTVTQSPSMGDASGIVATRSGTAGDFHAMVDKGDFHDYDPTQPIDSHRFYSIFAFIMFFPLGIFALYQSFNVVSKWKQQKYEEAHDKSQQALLYSRISCAIGISFWIYYLFFSGPGPFAFEFHWPAFAW